MIWHHKYLLILMEHFIQVGLVLPELISQSIIGKKNLFN